MENKDQKVSLALQLPHQKEKKETLVIQVFPQKKRK
jgi:hypothetical protein